jgi:hypothetical protein
LTPKADIERKPMGQNNPWIQIPTPPQNTKNLNSTKWKKKSKCIMTKWGSQECNLPYFTDERKKT